MRKLCLILTFSTLLTLPAPSGQWEKLAFPKGSPTTLLSTSRGLYASSVGRLYFSTDNAQTWDSLSRIPTGSDALLEVGDLLFSTSSYLRPGIDIEPLPCVFRSRDYGRSWDSLLAGLFGSPSLVMTGSKLYANPDGKLYASSDTGTIWTRIDGAGTFPGLVAGITADGSTLYVMIQIDNNRTNKLYRSSNGGVAWVDAGIGLPSNFLTVIARGDSVYVPTTRAEFFMSSDRGDSWRAVNAGLADSSGFRELFLVGNTLLASISNDSYQTVYRLDLSDTTWKRFDEGLQLPRTAYIYDFVDSGEYIFLATEDGVWRRPLADLAGAGAASDFFFPFGNEADEWVYEVYDNNDPWHLGRAAFRWGKDTVMANGKTYKPFGSETFDHFYLRQEGDRILQFAPWDTSEFARYDFSKAVGDTVARVVLQYGHSTSTIVLTGDSLLPLFGTLRRTLDFRDDYGIAGSRVVDSLGISSFAPNTEVVFSLQGARIGGRIYGDLTSLEEVGHQMLPPAPELAQNYPNPFNPMTTIRYALPQRSHVVLTVYNMLGQQVATLVNGGVDAGYHEVQFDASGLASGIYFCRLQAGDFTQTKKLCLVR